MWDFSRRKFLIRSCQGASTLALPASLWHLAFSETGAEDFQAAAAPEFHLRPHYRVLPPLDAVLQKVSAGTDGFVSEKYADQIASLLETWSSALRTSPQSIEPLKKLFGETFSGSSLATAERRQLRSGAIEIFKTIFSPSPVSRDQFLKDLQSELGGFSKLNTADFQIARIDANLPQIITRVRYELVGPGNEFHLQQRCGEWEIAWDKTPSDEFHITSWKPIEETLSRAASPVFADVTSSAFFGCSSYKSQLLHGSDYWRTVLDGASGIDIYGHNGVSVGDINNDGFDDLYVCQPAGLPNRLYRNRGDGTFEDITESSGVGLIENTSCALFVDVDNDGWQDLIVVLTSGPQLYLNDGAGKFHHKPDAFKFSTPPQGTFTGAAAADYDRDGWLDIYFCLYAYYQGTDQYKYPLPYYDASNGPPNFMMRNNRDGTFVDVTSETGLNQNNTRYSFCCGWNDYNRDGWPDLYVVNDFGRKNLYRNNGNGTFTDVSADAGVEDIGAGMSVCWFDYNNDGADDLYVANMWTAAGERISTQKIFQANASQATRALYQKHAMGNSLLRNDGATFRDTTDLGGVGMGRWAWSSDAWDFDHDGFPDLYITNGMVSGLTRPDLNSFFWRQVVANSPDAGTPSTAYEQGWNAINELIRADATWSGYERNVLYLNHGDGTFSDVSGAAGMDFTEDGRSFALADFDHDGRQEIFLKNRNAPQLRLLKNIMAELPASICFSLRGTKSNRDAIGAVVTVTVAERRQTRSLNAGSGFLSQHSKDLFFGLGGATGPISASVRWPSGLVQEFHDLPMNHSIVVEEGSSSIRTEPFKVLRQDSVSSSNSNNNDVAGKRDSHAPEPLPTIVETWLLSPIDAPDFSLSTSTGETVTLSGLRGKPVLLNFSVSESALCRNFLRALARVYPQWSARGLQLLSVNLDGFTESNGGSPKGSRKLNGSMPLPFPVVRGTEDVAAIYNTIYRYMFDRHRDLALPSTFLINEDGEIVKVYQGAVETDTVDRDLPSIPRSKAERISKGLPFAGIINSDDFSRNYLSYGSIFFQRGYYDQAGKFFTRAVGDDPSSAEALYGLGSVYLQQQKTVEAREAFERATKLQPHYPDTLPNAWNNLGLLATRDGRTEDAISYFQQALKLRPDYLIALENLGNAYREQKRWEDARQTLQHAVAVAPADPEANYSLGMVFAQLNQSDRAYDYLQRALKLRPAYPEALNNLGVLYLRTGRADKAVESFEQCIQVAPAFDQSYLNLARVYALEKAPDKARAVLLALLKQHPGHAQATALLQELGQ